MSQETPQRNLALDLVRVTEAAALASSRWLGKGDKERGDHAAVEAMRLSFSAIDINGTVVIGEGEKDEAPMLYNGEQLGTGKGPDVDVAVDPVEGTRLLAYGRPNAIAVVGLAPRGSMYNPGPAFYMRKMAVPFEAKYHVDIKAPVAENLRRVAKALGKSVDDMVVFVLDKPRHNQLVKEIRQAGARIQLHTDGDVAGALMATTPGGEVDMMIGTGGTPEGMVFWPPWPFGSWAGKCSANSILSPRPNARPCWRLDSAWNGCSPWTIWSRARTAFSRPRAFPGAPFSRAWSSRAPAP